MAASLSIDELNALNAYRAEEAERLDEFRERWAKRFPDELRRAKEDIWNEIYLFLFWEYLTGAERGTETSDTAKANAFKEVLAKEVDGATARERIDEHIENGDVTAVMTVMRTEGNRLYNAGVLSTAKAGAYKTWHTMLDEKVRDTHDYLESMTVPYEDPFYTYDGDYAMYPGDFALAQNNANCRCFITIDD